MMYVCPRCMDGSYYEDEEVMVPEHQPHGELLFFVECPKCGSRDLAPLDSEGQMRIYEDARHFSNSNRRKWAVDVLWDLASGQVEI